MVGSLLAKRVLDAVYEPCENCFQYANGKCNNPTPKGCERFMLSRKKNNINQIKLWDDTE